MVDLKTKAFDISQNFTISLDGPAASGKGTIGLILAKKFSLKYFQSSIVYRQLAFDCISQKIDVTDIDAVIALSKELKLDNNFDLENENIGNIASQIAVISEIRNNLNKYLINLVKTTPRMIMEGRDIGTVVAPDADLKIFITANPQIRAERRYKQLQAKGKTCILDEILRQIILRDKRDKERKAAPLLPASDALIIDTSKLSAMEVVEEVTNYIKNKIT
ncbi:MULTISPECIES: (d)CMP kinase [spotted fever group]|uniref:Cytidylate kinase n=5 Tax=spotted fever group TaxID=114277 RepID=KCY_RICAE|nr:MULTISPECIES: (d)CMP kinase [spotted fever group]C3PNP6.1 RecName: Full=Cytidylate kinase; Short=CK; AltName: Full=Cytidine monophosphate kinase; Short=CMP kinase [Rickettsia africae ESF-5]C4K1D2.1 RecName: Full=Cytidylate kinase; Short=CK; AltName: Full=Cytidine monophosphate kinase; Short=CMP kinase [Rickettsia peacockii str. Rustic]ACP53556.1 Cytidylate kinase [Rickettsia africae ESF-5]ACR47383.1 cytidylate kinase [Rickettsia peacockii str. Rustic]AEV92302.1 Cytidylate kinase [Rickettsia